MKKQALSLAVLVAGAYPAASNALSLGDIRSNSSLNQPLRAKIELLSADAQDARQLQVRLAPSNVFSRVGVDRPAFLDNLRFNSTVENGKPVILVTSDAPISEPFVNFLLEVSWPNGQLLKEYTVMLDPPVLMQPGTALAGQEAAVRAEPRPTGLVNRSVTPAPSASPAQIAAAQQAQQQRQQAAQQQAQARQQQAQQQRANQQQAAAQQRARQQQAQQQANNTSRTYRVRRGDTLFKVATRLQQPGVNVDQMMMALYRANPDAFIGKNINGLKAGAVLQAPSAQAAKSSSRAQARRQVRQQYAEWKQFRSSLAKNTVPQQSVKQEEAAKTAAASTNKQTPAATRQPDKARLEVLGKTDKASSATAAAGAAQLSQLEKDLALARESLVARQNENKELKSRLSDLESMLRKKNRLIALRDDQLAQLQKQLAEAKAATPAASGVQPAAAVQQQNAAVTGTANQPGQNVVPRTGNGVTPPEAGRDIQNQVTNTAQAEQNKVVRAQPPANQQVAAAERAAQQRAEELRRQQQAKANAQSQQATPPAAATEPDSSAAKSPFADEQEGGNDLMSLLSSPMAWKIGAGALASLLLLWLLSRLFGRRKTKAARVAPVAGDSMAYDDTADEASGHHFAGLEAELDKAEKTVDDGLDDDPFGTRFERDAPSDVNDIVEADSVQDEDEVLMEANVYIAYGLHQQAESELKKALDKHPGRIEYRHKLLENYFTSNNRDEFDHHAEEFLATPGADRNSKMWREIAEWGAKISPDNKLYQQLADDRSSAGLGAAAAAGVAVTAGTSALLADDGSDDYDIRDVQDVNEADDRTSLMSEDELSGGGSIDDDMSAALDELQDDELGLDDFDFDLDELESELGNLDNFESELTLSDESDESGHEADHAGQPDDESGDVELAATVDDSFDFSLDDLADELGHDDSESDSEIGRNLAAEIDDLEEPMDEPLDFDVLLNGADDSDGREDDSGSGLLGGIAAGAAAVAGTVTAAAVSGKAKVSDTLDDAGDTIDSLFGDEGEPDFAEHGADESGALGDTEFEPLDDGLNFDLDDLPGATDATVAEGDDDIDEFDFNLDDLNADVDEPDPVDDDVADQAGNDANKNVTNLNLHLDQDSGLRKILPKDTFYAAEEAVQGDEHDEDSWLGDIDDALSFLDMPDEEIDLHEAHISTKLDLARAYLDMGDIEGARSTLEEVMVEGNDNQRREAETLLHETG